MNAQTNSVFDTFDSTDQKRSSIDRHDMFRHSGETFLEEALSFLLVLALPSIVLIPSHKSQVDHFWRLTNKVKNIL